MSAAVLLLAVLLVPGDPATAASPVHVAEGVNLTPIATEAHPDQESQRPEEADAKAGEFKDGMLWRSHPEGIEVYAATSPAVLVPHDLVRAWADTGWENGPFGYPSGGHYSAGSDTRQPFTGGILGVRPDGTSYWLPATTELPDFTVSGAGWGHGVGMSQYGARAMAAGGSSATDILEYYYNPAEVTDSSTAAASDIRVQVLTSKTSEVVVSGGKMQVIDPTANQAYTAPAGSKLVLGRAGSQLAYELRTPDGFDVVPRDNNEDGVPDVDPAPEANKVTGKLIILWEGTRDWPAKNRATISVPGANEESSAPGVYRHGYLEAGLLDDRVNLVAALRLNDEYLYGLAEVPSSWPRAVLQAQAIAGRTYAMRKLNTVRDSCDCNVTDEVQDQKFTGWKKENEKSGYGARWKAAVEATIKRNDAGVPRSGKVVVYDGRLAETLYSSSTGGATRDSEDVWGGAARPYLRSRPDPWSLEASAKNPYDAWEQGTSQEEMAEVFGLENVMSVEFERGKDLSIVSATATSMSGRSKTLPGKEFRGKDSGVGARSAWITGIEPSVGPPVETTIKPGNFCTTTVKAGAGIARAVSAASDGEVICLQPGTPKPSSVVLKPRQTLVGGK
ncbi:SpoIID/LytB domain-containing protein [Paeniglutamicibacter sulfureus]|uniref:SpoIID/LytB domain protein n=1 Tax=Paeniglutamicibacter sulfureus TaxID=43666 RepID=A0ABU2BNU4_9MICC|nr:SpoIID/LytB domain-containing protein [Paeniglutamicibacter sulfureus]MDR7359368.1 SpoIID/LytB domain protein [Paeniglutamicibacter sulfureus]